MLIYHSFSTKWIRVIYSSLSLYIQPYGYLKITPFSSVLRGTDLSQKHLPKLKGGILMAILEMNSLAVRWKCFRCSGLEILSFILILFLETRPFEVSSFHFAEHFPPENNYIDFKGDLHLGIKCITQPPHPSGQIIICHPPRFPWNKGISLTKPPFGVRSCQVAIIWPATWITSLSKFEWKHGTWFACPSESPTNLPFSQVKRVIKTHQWEFHEIRIA